MKRQLLQGLLISLSFTSAYGAAPPWWTAQGTAIWDGVSTEYGTPVNVGQLKHVATMAKQHLENQLGSIDWESAYADCDMDPGDPGKNSPFPFPTSGDNYAPANVGQLKGVAYGFYQVLSDAGYPVRASLLYQGLESSDIGFQDGMFVPWNGFHIQEDHLAPANLGQLKLLFSFSVLPDGSSTFDLSGVVDDYSIGTDDQDGDAMVSGLEQLIGLPGSSYSNDYTIQSADEDPNVVDAVQEDGGSGPLIVLPDRGLYNVHQPELSLHKL